MEIAPVEPPTDSTNELIVVPPPCSTHCELVPSLKYKYTAPVASSIHWSPTLGEPGALADNVTLATLAKSNTPVPLL